MLWNRQDWRDHLSAHYGEMPPSPISGRCRWAYPLGPAEGKEQTGLLELTLDRKDTAYAVHRLFTDGKVAGFRVHAWDPEEYKKDPRMYDINVTVDPWHCSCPDYLFRREYKQREGCKHCRSLRAALAAIGQTPPQ